jgi:hypothetical protein
MKTIKLSRKPGDDIVAIVDDDDYDRINQFTWCYNKGTRNKTYYAIRGVRYGDKQFREYMHRVIMNAPDDIIVDHINHDTLDNRKENLRVGTQKLNQLNRISHGGSKSKYKGVSLFSNGKWVVHYKKEHIGYFVDEVDAALAYNAIAFKENPSWSLLNIIPGLSNEQLITMPASYKPRVSRNNYRGVRQRSANCFEAYIQIDNDRQSIGTFPTELDAVTAYNDVCDMMGLTDRKNII